MKPDAYLYEYHYFWGDGFTEKALIYRSSKGVITPCAPYWPNGVCGYSTHRELWMVLTTSINRKRTDGNQTPNSKVQYQNERPLLKIEKIVNRIDDRIEEISREIQGPSDSSEAKARRDELQKLKSEVLRTKTDSEGV